MSDSAASGGGGGGAGGVGGKKRVWTEGLDLIEQVRLRPCLWDRACLSYRHRGAKDKAWQDICRELEPGYADMSPADRHETALIVMRKWNNIRDAYKKSYNAKGNFAYKYASLLTFLIPGFDSKAKRECVAYERDDDAHEEKEEWLNVFDLEQPEAPPGPAPKRPKPELDYSRPKDTAETDDSILSVLVGLIEKEEDEDRAFFKSITPAVKSLPEDDKFAFRIQVMKLLKNLKKTRTGTKREIVTDESETE